MVYTVFSVALQHFNANIKCKRIFVCSLNCLWCYIHQNYLGWRWKAVTGVELAEWYEIMNEYFQPESDMVLQHDFTLRESLVWFPDGPQGADFAFSPKVRRVSLWISFHSPKPCRLAWPFNSMLVRVCVLWSLYFRPPMNGWPVLDAPCHYPSDSWDSPQTPKTLHRISFYR